MKTVVISQPYLFPWPGLFEQLRMADVFVHYDDVAFSKGSFVNRVQLKSPRGSEWMTVPIACRRFGDRILDLQTDDRQAWRQRHLDQLTQNYEGAPFRQDVLELVETVYRARHTSFADLLITGLDAVTDYFDLGQRAQFHRSSQLPIPGRSSQRVLDLVRYFGGDVYLTGHGAKNYLDHEAFEAAGVQVRYMDYQRQPYPQLHGPFDPHVSILDLIANCGREGARYLCSSSVSWREFLTRLAKVA